MEAPEVAEVTEALDDCEKLNRKRDVGSKALVRMKRPNPMPWSS
jgi:hypothetical protein